MTTPIVPKPTGSGDTPAVATANGQPLVPLAPNTIAAQQQHALNQQHQQQLYMHAQQQMMQAQIQAQLQYYHHAQPSYYPPPPPQYYPPPPYAHYPSTAPVVNFGTTAVAPAPLPTAVPSLAPPLQMTAGRLPQPDPPTAQTVQAEKEKPKDKSNGSGSKANPNTTKKGNKLVPVTPAVKDAVYGLAQLGKTPPVDSTSSDGADTNKTPLADSPSAEMALEAPGGPDDIKEAQKAFLEPPPSEQCSNSVDYGVDPPPEFWARVCVPPASKSEEEQTETQEEHTTTKEAEDKKILEIWKGDVSYPQEPLDILVVSCCEGELSLPCPGAVIRSVNARHDICVKKIKDSCCETDFPKPYCEPDYPKGSGVWISKPLESMYGNDHKIPFRRLLCVSISPHEPPYKIYERLFGAIAAASEAGHLESGLSISIPMVGHVFNGRAVVAKQLVHASKQALQGIHACAKISIYGYGEEEAELLKEAALKPLSSESCDDDDAAPATLECADTDGGTVAPLQPKLSNSQSEDMRGGGDMRGSVASSQAPPSPVVIPQEERVATPEPFDVAAAFSTNTTTTEYHHAPAVVVPAAKEAPVVVEPKIRTEDSKCNNNREVPLQKEAIVMKQPISLSQRPVPEICTRLCLKPSLHQQPKVLEIWKGDITNPREAVDLLVLSCLEGDLSGEVTRAVDAWHGISVQWIKDNGTDPHFPAVAAKGFWVSAPLSSMYLDKRLPFGRILCISIGAEESPLEVYQRLFGCINAALQRLPELPMGGMSVSIPMVGRSFCSAKVVADQLVHASKDALLTNINLCSKILLYGYQEEEALALKDAAVKSTAWRVDLRPPAPVRTGRVCLNDSQTDVILGENDTHGITNDLTRFYKDEIRPIYGRRPPASADHVLQLLELVYEAKHNGRQQLTATPSFWISIEGAAKCEHRRRNLTRGQQQPHCHAGPSFGSVYYGRKTSTKEIFFVRACPYCLLHDIKTNRTQRQAPKRSAPEPIEEPLSSTEADDDVVQPDDASSRPPEPKRRKLTEKVTDAVSGTFGWLAGFVGSKQE